MCSISVGAPRSSAATLVQVVRVDGDAALPLALQLLRRLCAGPGPRLDERYLSALGRGCTGSLIVTPVNWYQAPEAAQGHDGSPGRCADGGKSGPELHPRQACRRGEEGSSFPGWPYPRHLAGRLFAAVVHGDTVGAETLRRVLMDWAAAMHLIPAGPRAAVDGYIGYFEPYATSHEALDRGHDFQAEALQRRTHPLRGRRGATRRQAGGRRAAAARPAPQVSASNEPASASRVA